MKEKLEPFLPVIGVVGLFAVWFGAVKVGSGVPGFGFFGLTGVAGVTGLVPGVTGATTFAGVFWTPVPGPGVAGAFGSAALR